MLHFLQKAQRSRIWDITGWHGIQSTDRLHRRRREGFGKGVTGSHTPAPTGIGRRPGSRTDQPGQGVEVDIGDQPGFRFHIGHCDQWRGHYDSSRLRTKCVNKRTGNTETVPTQPESRCSTFTLSLMVDISIYPN